MRSLRLSARVLAALALPVGVLLPGCLSSAPGGRHVVFTVLTGFTNSGPAQVDEIIDVGMPGFYNKSGAPVRLRAIRLLAPSGSGLNVRNVVAYKKSDVGYGDVMTQLGDLPTECPGQFIPHRVSSVVVASHKVATYFVVISFTFPRPGIYHLRRAKIFYETNGRAGWQYQNLDVTFRISEPPRPGLTPVPTSSVCGRP